jgi:hypothetical protein
VTLLDFEHSLYRLIAQPAWLEHQLRVQYSAY